MKQISTIFGSARGSFKKAVRSVILYRYYEKSCFEKAKEELGNKCVYCGDTNQKLQPDHLIGEEHGGLYVIGNIVPSCPTCNSEREKKEWRDFVSDSPRIKDKTKTKARIEDYIQKHKGEKQHRWNKMEKELLNDLDSILFALCEAIRSKLGMNQKSDVKFVNQEQMFNEIMTVIKKYKK